MKKLLPIILLLVFALVFSLSACGGTGDSGNEGGNEGGTEGGSQGGSEGGSQGGSQGGSEGGSEGGETTLLKFDGVSFSGGSFTYDGAEHEITVSGNLPEGTSVTYTANKATNAGSYNATAKLEKEGYETKTLTATLVINKATYNMSSVSWSYTSPFTYDTEAKTVTLSGLPTGVTVGSYSNNTKTDAGNYTASVTLVYDTVNYNTPTVSPLNWKINKADITAAITFSDETVEYDTEMHSIYIVGNIPAGTTVDYTYNGQSVTGVSQVGSYEVVATVSGPNHNAKTFTATLTIKSTEELLYAVNHNGTVYFQNNLDGNKLYKVDGSGNITKVNNDKPEYFFSDGSALYYYSSSLFSKVLKKINSAGTVSTVANVSGEYITTDGTYVYYAVNNMLLNTDENGIYKLKLDGSQDTPTRIATTKAAYLTVYGSYVYYSNLSDGKKLYRVSTSGGTPTLIHDEKAEYLIEDNGVIYFDSSTLLASAIYKYTASSGNVTKMTTDSGKYLAKVGNDIYYVNNDLLTSNLFGDGIYKISVLASGSLPGTKVVEASEGDGYSSLTTDGEYLYYYKLSDKHLYRLDPDTETEVDLMEGFQPPVETVTLMGDTVIAEFGGEIYYTNPRDAMGNGGCLYKYNPTTKVHVKVLADDVAGIWFSGNYMYYSTCVLTNYALNRMDMTTGEIIKVNSNRCENLIFEGSDIYYIDVSATGSNRIMKMSADNLEAEPTEIYDEKNVSITGMYKSGNTFYFISNPTIGYQYLYKYTVGDAKGVSLDVKAKHMVLAGDKIYYFDGTSSSLKSCSLDGSSVKTVKTNVEINDMYLSGGTLYFASTSSQNKGLYSCNTATDSCAKLYSGLADGITVVNGKVWFIGSAVTYTADYPVHTAGGDGYLYCYNGTAAEKK